MKIYPWNEDTKEALHSIKKDDRHPNPIGRFETEVPTPENIPPGHAARAVLTDEGWFDSWEMAVDNRGKEYWSQDGVQYSISDLGAEVPTDCLTVPPPSSFHSTHDGSEWIVNLSMLTAARRQERDGKLASAYSSTLEQLSRWIDSVEDAAAQEHYKAQRTAWHAWADALCDLPNQPGFPWPEEDVPWPEQPPKPTRYTP